MIEWLRTEARGDRADATPSEMAASELRRKPYALVNRHQVAARWRGQPGPPAARAADRATRSGPRSGSDQAALFGDERPPASCGLSARVEKSLLTTGCR